MDKSEDTNPIIAQPGRDTFNVFIIIMCKHFLYAFSTYNLHIHRLRVRVRMHVRVCVHRLRIILENLCEKYGKDSTGLYRDDGLAIFRNISGPEVGRIRKDIAT